LYKGHLKGKERKKERNKQTNNVRKKKGRQDGWKKEAVKDKLRKINWCVSIRTQ
jgi:hypothetical protein